LEILWLAHFISSTEATWQLKLCCAFLSWVSWRPTQRIDIANTNAPILLAMINAYALQFIWNGGTLHWTILHHHINLLIFIIQFLTFQMEENMHVSFCPCLGERKKKYRRWGADFDQFHWIGDPEQWHNLYIPLSAFFME
jgi:hypothetical protein